MEREIELHSWLLMVSTQRCAVGIITCKCGSRRLGCLWNRFGLIREHSLGRQAIFKGCSFAIVSISSRLRCLACFYLRIWVTLICPLFWSIDHCCCWCRFWTFWKDNCWTAVWILCWSTILACNFRLSRDMRIYTCWKELNFVCILWALFWDSSKKTITLPRNF